MTGLQEAVQNLVQWWCKTGAAGCRTDSHGRSRTTQALALQGLVPISAIGCEAMHPPLVPPEGLEPSTL